MFSLDIPPRGQNQSIMVIKIRFSQQQPCPASDMPSQILVKDQTSSNQINILEIKMLYQFHIKNYETVLGLKFRQCVCRVYVVATDAAV